MSQIGLKDLFAAGYPLVHVETTEYLLAETAVMSAASSDDIQEVLIWKATGLRRGVSYDAALENSSDEIDLVDALLLLLKSEKPTISVWYNLREFVKSTIVFQALIECAIRARMLGSHLVLIGPAMEIPPELQNYITVYRFPLPSVEELFKSYSDLAVAYASSIVDEKGRPWELRKSADGTKVLNSLQKAIVRQAAMAALGLDFLTAENALALSMASSGTIDLEIIRSQKEQEVKRSDVLEFIRTDEDLSAVGGFDSLKSWLLCRRGAFSERARKYGLPYPKGILLVGPGGTGKSLCAKAVARCFELPLLRLDMGSVFRSLLGESEAAIRKALQIAEAVAPCILWLDELDKGLAGSSGSGSLDSGVSSRVVGTLLTWRAETTAPVMLVATANDITSLPGMVYRKGRLTGRSQADVKQLKLLESPKACFATAQLETVNANA